MRSACLNGHLEVAQWVYSLGGVDYMLETKGLFRWAYQNGHSEVIEYLLYWHIMRLVKSAHTVQLYS